jgi:hypothetical protein
MTTYHNNIVTHFDFPPIPTRDMDWSCVSVDYDGAEDAGWQPVGHGATEAAAIADYLLQVEDRDEQRQALAGSSLNLHKDAIGWLRLCLTEVIPLADLGIEANEMDVLGEEDEASLAKAREDVAAARERLQSTKLYERAKP